MAGVPANWVFLAVPLALLVVAYLIYSLIEYIREQRFLHAVFDGDRIQQWRSDRYNARHIRKFAARSGRRFY